MNKTIKLYSTVGISVFIAIYITFSIIHMSKVNYKLNEWNESYRAIQEDVSAFTKLSNPKTIRLYVKELHDILDNIHFLSKIVKSGQLADESLMNILNRQTKINQQLLNIVIQVENLEDNYNSYVIKNDTRVNMSQDNNDELFETVDSLTIEVMPSYMKRFETIRADIDSIKTIINTLQDSKINKFWK